MPLDRHALQQADWAAAFPEAVLARGRSCAKQGLVRILRVTAETIEARCHGGAERPYRQDIRLSPQQQHWRVQGRCSCPVAYNCKHVVAALLLLEQLQQRGDPLAREVADNPAAEPVRSDLPPQPRLRLGSVRRQHFDSRRQRLLEQTQHRAALAFVYAGQAASGPVLRELQVRGEDGRALRIRRQPAVEAQLRTRLRELGLRPALRRSEALPEDAGEPLQLPDQASWLAFVEHALPQLRDEGWQIEIDDSFLFDLQPIDSWYVQLDETPGQSGFVLEAGIVMQGRRISLLPLLQRLLRQQPELFEPRTLAAQPEQALLLIELPTGERVGLPYGRLRPLLQGLAELQPDTPLNAAGGLALNDQDAARLTPLQALAPHWLGSSRLRELAARLEQLGHGSLPAPPGLQAELRPYQCQGLAWMQGLRELGMGGVLADDMGLGKTLQSLAHLLMEKQAGRLQQPALIVMPTSLIGNWQSEAARFAPQLRVLALQGPGRRRAFAGIGEHDLVLTSYALLQRDLAVHQQQHYALLILDEAQTIKNPQSRIAQAVCALQAGQRLCLTGTPLENHLGELWSLFNFLAPGWLGDAASFRRHYRLPIERDGDRQCLARLQARVRPFMLRRRKQEVARELPPKTEIIHWVELGEAQRERYESLRAAMDSRLREQISRQGLAASRMLILEALLRLRQVCCDLRLLGDDSATGPAQSAKLVSLLRMLEELFAEGRRVLLFSQFSRMLELIAEELRRRRIPFAYLTGASRDRQEQISAFQDGELPIFLISLKAGGTGLNLTAADTVIHFDPWWNPAVEDQASDRAYRIGQDKPVFVYRLIARGSVEQRIQQLQQAKAELARGILEGGSGHWALAGDELDQLLAPLG